MYLYFLNPSFPLFLHFIYILFTFYLHFTLSQLYIYGGIKRSSVDNNVLEDLGDMFVLDTESLEWREERCLNTPPPRCGHKMVAMRGKLYLFGGGAGEDWALTYNDINVYDPSTKVFSFSFLFFYYLSSSFSFLFLCLFILLF